MHTLQSILENNSHLFGPVIPFDPVSDKLLAMDFSSRNQSLTKEIVNDINLFCGYVNDLLGGENARYGIGGYGEYREIYSRSKVFDDKEEPRRLHIGLDIWGKPHTPVMAPLDAIVHSFAFNNRAGDYGTTILLTHQLDGLSFHTLYGHLGLNGISNLQEGDRIEKGDIFAEFGIPAENGQWPPHLHFQLIRDLQGWNGDYPGVCKYSEKEKYLENCPDPDLIVQLKQYIKTGS